jgi:hypothetical protein
MTRGGKNARRGVDRLEAAGRLRKARAFHRVAQDAFALLEREALDHAPVLSNASLAAIAYTDAVTISADGSVNRKDHSTAAALLRDCVGRDLPDARLPDLRSLLSMRDEVQYGARTSAREAAARAVEQLDRFAAWAVSWLEAKGVT